MTTIVKTVATNSLITIGVGASLEEANLLMKENRIRHLPVTDTGNTIVGILSQTDMKLGVLTRAITVEMMMSSPVESINQDSSLRAAILTMLEKKISCLLITNEKEDVIGIVTTDDLLWHLAQFLKDEPKQDGPLLSALNLQTIGNVAHDLANFGI